MRGRPCASRIQRGLHVVVPWSHRPRAEARRRFHQTGTRSMRPASARVHARVLALLCAFVGTNSLAALPNGTQAPDFTAQASLAGKPFTFSLSEALKQGPVVLYFYPAAFTSGCTIEAHNFAEATDQFKALGATVIGVSNDDIETLHRFSVSEFRNKFGVAADAC